MAIDSKKGQKLLQPIKAIPFQGGAITVRPRALLNAGQFSMIQDLRPKHPGFKTRLGQNGIYTDADGTLGVTSLYQFSKGKRTERWFFAQMSDGDIHCASNDPPAVETDGGFGDQVYSGVTAPRPAAWSHMDDILLMSNGVDQHQLFAGSENNVTAFVIYKGSAAPPRIPEEGFDYSLEVADFSSTSSADLSSLQTLSDYECLFIRSPIPANRLKFTMSQVNGTAATATVRYRNTSNTWANASATDGTANGGKTFAQTGAMYWTYPSDEMPCYMFGRSGFWYRINVSATLDSAVTVTACEYGTDGKGSGTRTTFTPLRNVWDGDLIYSIEARLYDASAAVYYTYPSDQIQISNITSSDKVYFNSFEKAEAFYVDVGDTPNTTASTTINSVYYWDGDSWAACTNVTDGTNGLANSGWVTFDRVGTQHKTMFQTAKYHSYWYYFTVDKTLSSSVNVSVEVMPHFDINEAGTVGHTSIAWKDRAVYSFGNQYIYISATKEPMMLNGDDFAILQAGDGRANKCVCMRRFHNEIMVWQEERGVDGGCLTLFEGYNPATFGKLVLSTRVGTFNNKSAVVVDGVLTSTASDETLKTLAFFLSHYGVCATDGRTVTIISDDIQNYFDSTDADCIRRGYEDKMWIDLDSSANGLRVGLVTGSTATTCNTFLFYDLIDKVWMFDNPAQELGCHAEVEAATGGVDRIQYGGGVDDGMVYQLNTTASDDGSAIDSYLTMELTHRGLWLSVREMLLTMKAQTGNITVTPYQNEVAGTAITLSQAAEITSDAMRRHRFGIRLQGAHVSVKIQQNTLGDSMYLYNFGAEVYEKEGH